MPGASPDQGTSASKPEARNSTSTGRPSAAKASVKAGEKLAIVSGFVGTSVVPMMCSISIVSDWLLADPVSEELELSESSEEQAVRPPASAAVTVRAMAVVRTQRPARKVGIRMNRNGSGSSPRIT